MKIYDGTAAVDVADEGALQKRRPERQAVGVAEYGIVDDESTLVTSGLGSCVAVGITDTVNAAGLIHVMLPSTDGRSIENPAKYADTGVAVMLRALAAANVERDQCRAKIAGGSEMIAFDSQELSIGDRNVEAVRRALAAEGIPIAAEDVGGDEGRTVEYTLSGDLVVKTASSGVRHL